jgi:hypothetical protein
MAIYWKEEFERSVMLRLIDRQRFTYRSVAFAIPCNTPDYSVRLKVPARQRLHADDEAQRLIEDPQDLDDRCILRLRDELGDDAEVVEGALGIGKTHVSVEEGDVVLPARMVHAYRGARVNRWCAHDRD